MTTLSLTRTLIALAVGQLLVACTPMKPQFVSHFSANTATATAAEAAVSPPVLGADTAAATEATPAESDTNVRTIIGTGERIAPSKPYQREAGQPVTLNLEDVPVAQLVRTVLGDILNVDYVLHPPIGGNVTLSTKKPVSPDEALNLMEIALQANGMAMVRDTRGVFHIGRVDALRSLGAAVRVADGSAPLAPGYGAIVIPLQYIGAPEMASILRPMAHDGAILRVDSVRNLLVMSGTRAQAEGWLDMVRTFDVDLLQGMSVGLFPLKYLSIEEASAALQLLSGGMGGGAGASAVAPVAAGGARAGGAAAAPAAAPGIGSLGNTPLSGALHILPVERLNSLLVITPYAPYLEQVKRWMGKFDQPGSASSQAQLHIYRVQNGSAKHLADVLSGIFGGSSSGTTSNSGVAPGLSTATSSTTNIAQNNPFGNNNSGTGSTGAGLRLGGSGVGSALGGGLGNAGQPVASGAGSVTALGNIRVMADELNNSVLVWGTGAEYERIEAALKRLDVPPTQVLIEASIIEVTLNDTLRYGLEWTFNGSGGGGGRTGSGSLIGSSSSNGSGTGTGSGLGDVLGAGFSYTVRNSAGNVRAVLNALSSKTDLKVVASPTLMVLDNHTAAINVGTQQPFEAGQTINSDGKLITNNLQYKDTGVSLEVTPSVNAGNIVTMTVNQSVTDVGAQDEVTKQRSFLQRQVSSRVAVRSGESIVMGGLIQESASKGRSGVPWLHDIPVVGNLFGSSNTEGLRTELIVIITPRVVRNDVDVREVGDSLRQHMGQLTPLLKPVPVQPDPSEEPAPSPKSPVQSAAQPPVPTTELASPAPASAQRDPASSAPEMQRTPPADPTPAPQP